MVGKKERTEQKETGGLQAMRPGKRENRTCWKESRPPIDAMGHRADPALLPQPAGNSIDFSTWKAGCFFKHGHGNAIRVLTNDLLYQGGGGADCFYRWRLPRSRSRCILFSAWLLKLYSLSGRREFRFDIHINAKEP